MKTYFLLLAGLALIGCSTYRHKTQEIASMATKQQHNYAVHDTVALKMVGSRHAYHLSGQMNEVSIKPRGSFHYHPDSGYTGEAEAVSVRRLTLTHHAEAAKQEVSGTSTSAVQAAQQTYVSTTHETGQQQLDRAPAVPRFGWGWLATAVILLTGAWLYRQIGTKL